MIYKFIKYKLHINSRYFQNRMVVFFFAIILGAIACFFIKGLSASVTFYVLFRSMLIMLTPVLFVWGVNWCIFKILLFLCKRQKNNFRLVLKMQIILINLFNVFSVAMLLGSLAFLVFGFFYDQYSAFGTAIMTSFLGILFRVSFIFEKSRLDKWEGDKG